MRIRALDTGDPQRAAWRNCDPFSTKWVTCLPTRDGYLDDAEFGEVAARYYGLPSPACASRQGEMIGNSGLPLDAYGHRLSSLVLPGDGRRTQHDCLKWRIAEHAREMGARLEPEVYGLFAPCIPQAGRNRLDSLPMRKRLGLVPDFVSHLQWD